MNSNFELPGTPVSQGRPRLSRFGGTYDPKSKEKKAAKQVIAQQWKNAPLDEPLSVSLNFDMPIPTSWSKRKKAEAKGRAHANKPDCDNLAKFTLDVLNGIVYCDDSRIHSLTISKRYSTTPRTLIKVIPDASS